MNNNSVRYNDVFKVLFQIREPLSLREISKRVAAHLNFRQQDIEDNVARIVQSGVAIGLLVQVGDAYSYYTYAAKPSQKSLPTPQEPDVGVQVPDNVSPLPSSVISLSHSGSVAADPKDDVAADILAEPPSARRSRSTQRVGSYRSQQAPDAAKSTTESAKRQLSSTRSQGAKRAAEAQKSRTLSLQRDEEPCTSSCRPVVTRERIADLMASAGLNPRSRPFRVAETLLAEELNRDSQEEEESGAEDRNSDETNAGFEDDDDGDSELMFDGVLYNGCGHTSTTDGADINMQCPLETPEDCPACQRRKQMASRKRRQKSKKRNKSRSKSRAKRRRR